MNLEKLLNTRSGHKNKLFYVPSTIRKLTFKTTLFTIASKPKYLGINLVKNSCTEKCKTLFRESFKDWIKGEYTM